MWQMTPEKVKLPQNASNTSTILRNIHLENPLSYLFFSERNISSVQNLLRYVVHQQMGQVIDTQSRQELLIVMRAIYLEYANHPKSLESAKTQEQKNVILKQTVKEVHRLNELVVNETVPKIASQLQQYMDYLRDSSTQPVQINDPINDSIKGQKNYRSTTQVLFGGNF
jgi:hypothetical protein